MDEELGKVITSIITVCGGLFGTILVAALSAWYNGRTLKQLRLGDEKKEIFKKLNEFYGPYQQKLETSRQLYDKLKEGKPADFRTLTFLLDGNKFSGNDKAIYEEIRKITDELEELRMEKGGLVDELDLQKLLAKAGAHYRIISMAYDDKLKGETKRFEDYVYPRELNNSISDKINRLQQRIVELNK